jgi:hypothetical protein
LELGSFASEDADALHSATSAAQASERRHWSEAPCFSIAAASTTLQLPSNISASGLLRR